MTDRTSRPANKISDEVWFLQFFAWVLALAATLGALFIGEIMGQAPCLLCWYQRAFMFPLPIIFNEALPEPRQVAAVVHDVKERIEKSH